MEANRRIESFKEFWPYYLSEHRLAQTRRWHFTGTSLAFASLIALAYTGQAIFAFTAVFCGYGAAWFAHFKIEKNRPATYRYPIWSFLADLKLWFLILIRRSTDL